MSKENLFALHVSIAEMKEICAAEREHAAHIRSDPGAADAAENVLKKTALLLDFAKQRQVICAAKANAARCRKEYETFTFGAPLETEQTEI